MKLHIFGHSIVTSNTVNGPDWITHPETFVDKLYKKYNVDYTCLHWYTMCSEERILYLLKKQTIDIAIIFHGHPDFMFFPPLKRDFNFLSRCWHEDQQKLLENLTDVKYSVNRWLDQFDDEVEIINKKNFTLAFQNMCKFGFTHDANKNRFYGSLIQIDQYLSYKKIPVIHCPMDNIPNWFSFSSGIVDYDITKMQNDDSPYSASYNKSANAIDEEGNEIIFNKLSNYIDELMAPTPGYAPGHSVLQTDASTRLA